MDGHALSSHATSSSCSRGHSGVPPRHRLGPLILARVPPALPSNSFLLSFVPSKVTVLTTVSITFLSCVGAACLAGNLLKLPAWHLHSGCWWGFRGPVWSGVARSSRKSTLGLHYDPEGSCGGLYGLTCPRDIFLLDMSDPPCLLSSFFFT